MSYWVICARVHLLLRFLSKKRTYTDLIKFPPAIIVAINVLFALSEGTISLVSMSNSD